MEFTVHVYSSIIKGHRKSGVISIIGLAHIQWNNVRFLPVTATLLYQSIKCKTQNSHNYGGIAAVA